ncbi:MAG: hypothetical protein B6D62_01165 [Candidatus Cloacimonas sp. 4484_275]|nr:MAG: hypothetical protein B6D62_01165 [Candidatus Cloacimonas sp. 4484_275]
MDIREFLKQFEEWELQNWGILNTSRNLLNSKSVPNLINLMKRKGIKKLEGPRNWFIDINYNFRNPNSKSIKYGNLKNVSPIGVVFDLQNNILNPFYKPFNKINHENTNGRDSYFGKYNIMLDTTVFANEDISKPENRINLSLFGLFLIDEFREWFLEQFTLPTDAVIFPSANLRGGIRPDFAVHNQKDKPIAYIEVEIGQEDFGQLQNFRRILSVPVLSLCGKKEHKGQLSLLEIYDKLKEIKRKINSKQFDKNFAVFETLIYENVLSYGRERYKSTTISEEMRETTIVKKIMDKLTVHEDVGRNMYPGEIMIETKKEHGFSLRIYSYRSKVRHSLSVMARSGGRPEIIFPSQTKLKKYLSPRKENAIHQMTKLLRNLGFDNNLPETRQCRVPIHLVEENIDNFIEIIRELSKI